MVKTTSDVAIITQPQGWTPRPGDEVWYTMNQHGDGVRATVLEADGDGALIRPFNGAVDVCVTLAEIEPVPAKGAEAAAIMESIVSAPDPEEKPEVPQFIADRSDLSIEKQVSYLEAVAESIQQDAVRLAGTLKPFLNQGEMDGEPDDAKHDQPALPNEASPLAERLNQAQGKLAAAYKQLRYIARRLQP